jgi:hypothetical protein
MRDLDAGQFVVTPRGDVEIAADIAVPGQIPNIADDMPAA